MVLEPSKMFPCCAETRFLQTPVKIVSPDPVLTRSQLAAMFLPVMKCEEMSHCQSNRMVHFMSQVKDPVPRFSQHFTILHSRTNVNWFLRVSVNPLYFALCTCIFV